MKIDNFDLENDILVVAEIGNNHEGSYSLGEEMVGLSAESGVNAVKFQTFKTESYISRKEKDRYNRLKSFELSYDEFEKLSKVANNCGLIFLSTPFDIESAHFLNTIVPAFKIASGDNTFFPLIETIASFAKPILLSTGMIEIEQLKKTLTFINKTWEKNNINEQICILHCTSAYPTPINEVNLSVIQSLKKVLNCAVGYSDHTLGIDAAVLSVAFGARVIEKHFTINKNYSDFPDHQLSADPKDMADLVKKVQLIKKLIGNSEKLIQPSEELNIIAARRSIVAKRNLSKGTKIKWEDLNWVRPGNGLPPGTENLIVGKVLSEQVKIGELINENLLL